MGTLQRGYPEIKEMILLGTIPMGARIVEARLAEQLGISRTPVREALRRLTSDGLVEFHPNRGYQAVSYSPQDVAAIYSCRALLESEAVRLIAENGLGTTGGGAPLGRQRSRGKRVHVRAPQGGIAHPFP